ncbi:hypothetical protein BJL95_05505 [Methylomonas sp. LWB]|uniref:hypothetical protein n=1 Tax=Methylomonas sp. LWB TaxID=1905845 RepID=UPI0008D9014A|nr:hypothetical protein [Methylomonas sp. LWB]OHX37480.1 hypothetical protein BJL95_05505 [Methylomonas sp. LWB]
MKLLKLLLAITVGAGAYNHWLQHRQDSPPGSSETLANVSSAFVELPAISGQSPSSVIVVAAEHCLHADARRADRLAEDLSRNGVPVVRTHSVNFDIPNGGQADLDKIDQVMAGPLPVVFVHGRAKANPTLDEVLSEFRSSEQ